jgi:hypothetical protein
MAKKKERKEGRKKERKKKRNRVINLFQKITSGFLPTVIIMSKT